MSLLLIELPHRQAGASPSESMTDSVFHYALTRDGATTASTGASALSTMPRADQVVLVVPPAALSWHEVQLPRLPANKALAATQALLEDELLQDTDQVHLAFMPAHALRQAGRCWVAACDRAWLTQGVQAVESALGRPVSRLAPLLCPGINPTVLAMSDGAEPRWFQTSEHGVFTWPLHQAQNLGLPADTRYFAEAAVASQASEVSKSPALWSISTREALLMQALTNDWDLAQHDLQRSAGQQRRDRWRKALEQCLWHPQWRWPRRGLIALLAMQLVGHNLYAWMEHSAAQGLRQDMNALLQRSFPQVTVVVDAPAQMRRQVQELATLKGQAPAGELQRLLQLAGQSGSAQQAQGLDYSAQRLSLRGAAPDAARWPQVQQQAMQAGLLARIEGKDLVLEVKP